MFKLPHQQDTEPGAWPPCLLWELVFFQNCILSLCSTCVAFRSQIGEALPEGKGIEGCSSSGLGECTGGRCSSKFQELHKTLG